MDAAPRAIASTLLLVVAAAGSTTPTQGPSPTPIAGVLPTRVATSLPALPSTPVPTPSATPVPTPSATPTPMPAAPPDLRWGIIGDDGTHLASERAAGLRAKVFELSWSAYEPLDGGYEGAYVSAKRAEATALRAAGFALILSLGVQYPPAWVLAQPDSRYVDQFGTAYDDASPGSGRANFVWNDHLRDLQARYVARVFADLGTDWAAVRIGGGRYGELGYPVATYGGRSNTYWAFDANAARSNPVPGWKPGMSSPHGEAATFAGWYLDRLAGYAAWQAATVRTRYPGPLMLLLPSFGVRPGQLQAAVAGDLAGTTSPEVNGEIQRGYDYARQADALAGLGGIVLTTTWLDCPYGDDRSSSAVDWRPVHYISSLAANRGMTVYGENTGQGSASVLAFTASQAETYGLLGFAWFDEEEVYGGGYATIDDLAALIRARAGSSPAAGVP